MTEKSYSINEACAVFSIPRSVLMNGAINWALQTTLKYDTVGSRCRHKHYVTEKDAKEFYQQCLASLEERAVMEEEPAKRTYSHEVDTFNLAARRRLEDLSLLRELAGLGVCAEDLM